MNSNNKTRAVILKDIDAPNELTLAEKELDALQKDEVLVKITSIGLNRADTLYPHGRYFFKPTPNSRIGFEGAGIVEACGESVHLKVGDAVGLCPMSFDVATQGCMADHGIYQESQLIPTPPSVNLEDGGAIWMAYLTAWGGLVDAGNIKENDAVVITAASSSVGIAAIQLSNLLGATSIATTTSEDKARLLSELGADHVIVQERGDAGIHHYVDRISEITDGKGSDLVFDAVAGPASHGLVKASKRGGTIIIHGLLDRRPMDIHAGVLMKRLLTIKGYTLDQTLENQVKKTDAIAAITNGFEQGALKPFIAERFDLSAFQNALDRLVENKHTGKIVINP